MLRLHRLNDQEVMINAELIEIIEAHGKETVVRLTTGNFFVVKEAVDDVLEKNREYRRSIAVERRTL